MFPSVGGRPECSGRAVNSTVLTAVHTGVLLLLRKPQRDWQPLSPSRSPLRLKAPEQQQIVSLVCQS